MFRHELVRSGSRMGATGPKLDAAPRLRLRDPAGERSGRLALLCLVIARCNRGELRLEDIPCTVRLGCMWHQFCKIADPDGSHRRDNEGFNIAALRQIFSFEKLRLRGVDCHGHPVGYDARLCLSKHVSWEVALRSPDQVWVAVESSVIQDLDESKPEGRHAMYAIGADRGQLIIMNTWGELDLRAIDQSWYENRCGMCFLVDIVQFRRVL
mmetsp:Transcript_109701/g.353876  ORF Transcript_109701/g.353876 Transcript_109701/m.353876 type:complete len:211 (-) Transcript_109701:122-754(-)